MQFRIFYLVHKTNGIMFVSFGFLYHFFKPWLVENKIFNVNYY